jgi:hypothetical protein
LKIIDSNTTNVYVAHLRIVLQSVEKFNAGLKAEIDKFTAELKAEIERFSI